MNHFKIIFLFCFVCLVSNIQGQNIIDKCFSSPSIGADFGTSPNISNSGGDLGKYVGNDWQGANLGVTPPYACESGRAIKISDASSPKDVVGFKLSEDMNSGTFISFDFKVIKTAGNFSLGVYTGDSNQFYDGDIILANSVTTENANFGNWTDIQLTFSVPFNSNDDNWLYLRAESGTGVIANICQNGITIPVIELGEDIEICEGDNTTLDITTPGGWYSWSNGSTDPVITPSNEGTYEATAYNLCGSSTDEVYVTVYQEPELNVTADTIVCEGSVVTLEAPGWNASYVWNDNTTESTLTVDSAGFYSVTVTDNCFTITDDVDISYLSPPEVDLGPDSTVCGGTVDYYVANGGPTSEYSWSNGVESPGISITETDNYSVTITNMCGSASDNVYVEFSLSPGDVLPYSKEFCEGKPMNLDLSSIDGYFEWSDGTTDPIFAVPNPGWHYVEIIDDDSCFTITDTIRVDRIFCDCPVHLANSFTPNGDGINDTYNIVFDCAPYDYELTIYDRWGHTVFYTNDPNRFWEGKNGNGTLLPSSLYHYVLRYSIQYQSVPEVKRGTVTLIKD